MPPHEGFGGHNVPLCLPAGSFRPLLEWHPQDTTRARGADSLFSRIAPEGA